jgi:hypothetical protein
MANARVIWHHSRLDERGGFGPDSLHSVACFSGPVKALVIYLLSEPLLASHKHFDLWTQK